MKRYDVIKRLVKLREDELMVCNIGFSSRELFGVGDDPKNFYMLGSLGLASSIGLGIALNSKRKVWVIDGDGSMLMNLGSLATIANQEPENLVLWIMDNGAYGSTGGQPTCTAGVTDLQSLAKGAGVRQVFLETELYRVEEIAQRVRREPGPYVVVVKTEAGNHPAAIIPMKPLEIKKRFMEEI